MKLILKFLVIYLGIFFKACQASGQFKYLETCWRGRVRKVCNETQVRFECSRKYQVGVGCECEGGINCDYVTELNPGNFKSTKTSCKKSSCILEVIPRTVVTQECSDYACVATVTPSGTAGSSTSIGASRAGTTTTSKRFYITLDLPYSIGLGEKLLLSIKLHNEEPGRDTSAKLTITKSVEFEISGENPREIHCPRNSVTPAEFWLTPLKHGVLALHIRADARENSYSGDALFAQESLSKNLRVTRRIKNITRKSKVMEASSTEKEAYAIKSDFPEQMGGRGTVDIVISLSADDDMRSDGMGSLENKGESASVDIFGVNTLTDPPTIYQMATNVQVDPRNVLQEFKSQGDFDVVYFQIGGVGRFRAVVTWIEYLENSELLSASNSSAFSLTVTPLDGSTNTNLEFRICARYLLGNVSNMAVMEIHLPSGATVEAEGSDVYTRSRTFKCLEISKGGGKIEFHFSCIKSYARTCAAIRATQKFTIENLLPTYVKVYDYFEPNTTFVEAFYSAR